MSEIIRAVGELGGLFLDGTLRSTLVVAGALGISWLFRGRWHPALMSGMWLLVIARLLVPWSFPVAIPGLPASAVAPVAVQMPVLTPVIASEVPDMETSMPTTASTTPIAPTGGNWIALIWILGAVAVLAMRVVVHVRFMRVLRRSRPLDMDRFQPALSELCAAMGVRRRVRFVESGAVDAPCVFGTILPVCIFPAGLIARLDEAAFRHIAAHELAHVKRGDVLLQWMGALASIVHWFNPLVWVALARQRADAELAADAKVLRHLGTGTAPEYGETLLRIATQGGWKAFVGMPPVVGGGSQVAVRVRAIARGHHYGCRSAVVGATLLLTIAVAGFCEPTRAVASGSDAAVAKTAAKLSAAGDAWRKRLLTPVSIEFEDVPLKKCLDYLSKTCDLPLVYSPASRLGLASGIPLINLKEVTAGSFLDVVLRERGLVCVPGKEALWIGALGEAPDPVVGALDEPILAQTFGKPGSRARLLEDLESKVSCEFEGISIEQVLSFLSDTFRINFVLDPRVVAFEAPLKRWPGVASNGKILYAKEEKISVRDLLAKLLPQGDLPPTNKQAVELLGLREGPEQKIQMALIWTPLRLNWFRVGSSFEQYTLKSVDMAAKTVVLVDDRQSKEITLTFDETKEPDGDKTISTVLGLDFSVEEEYVWISSPEILRREARWYGK